MSELTNAVTALAVDPEVLVDRTVTLAFERVYDTVNDVLTTLRGARNRDQ